jgi:plastocyanin
MPPAPRVIPITVGSPTRDKSLRFYPENVRANPGDVLQFQFSLENHTVTQSPGLNAPCSPLQEMVPTAIHSGFIPGIANGTEVPTFDVPVISSQTMWIYCAQGPHCQLGMVMVVNGYDSILFRL